MLRQKTGPATIAANNTSASMPSSSCSFTRCSGEPVPAASATLRPKGCQVPSARPARKSRKLASNSGCPSIISASPPSGRRTVCGARSRYFSGTRCTQRSGGTSRCPSADIRLYCRAIPTSVLGAEVAPHPSPLPASGAREGPAQREGEGQQAEVTYYVSHQLALDQCAGRGAVIEALTAAGALPLLHLVQMPRLQQSRPDRRLRAHLTAEAAGIADRVVDPHLHLMPPTWCNK